MTPLNKASEVNLKCVLNDENQIYTCFQGHILERKGGCQMLSKAAEVFVGRERRRHSFLPFLFSYQHLKIDRSCILLLLCLYDHVRGSSLGFLAL